MWTPPDRIPDGDTVLAPGQQHSLADLLGRRSSAMQPPVTPNVPAAGPGANIEDQPWRTGPTQQTPAVPLLTLPTRLRTSGNDR
jgi:hypothetical protein